MQLLLSYGVPVLLVFLGGRIGDSLNQQFAGSVIGFALAIIYLAVILRPEFLMMRGTGQIKKGEIKKGLSYYDKALKTKLRVDYVIYAAYTFLRYGYTDKCKAALDRAETSKKLSNALSQELMTTKGLYLWKTGDLDGAEKSFRAAHELGENSQTYSHIGFILLEQKRYDEAYEFNKSAMEYNSGDVSIKDNMALSHYYMGENDEALSLYSEIMESGTRFPVIYYNYALCLIKAGRLEDAKEQLDCALTYGFSNIAAVSKEAVEKKLDEVIKMQK